MADLYDPGRKPRKGKVPPQLRAWVYRKRRAKYDPSPKYLRKGKRGGRYFTAGRGRSRRYDPGRRYTRARRYGSGILGFVRRYAKPLGFAVGFFGSFYLAARGQTPQAIMASIQRPAIITNPMAVVRASFNPRTTGGKFVLGGIVLEILRMLPIPMVKKLPKGLGMAMAVGGFAKQALLTVPAAGTPAVGGYQVTNFEAYR